MIDDAMKYYEQGFCVIPVIKGQKRPAIKWERYQAQRPDRNEVEKWFTSNDYNIGIICGCVSGGLVVFDFDGNDWLKGLQSLIKFYPPIFDTCAVKTGGGKHHLWVRIKDLPMDITHYTRDFNYSKETQTGAHVELRANKHYVLAPPSIHPSGKKYEFYPNIPIIELSVEDLNNIISNWFNDGKPEKKVNPEQILMAKEIPIRFVDDNAILDKIRNSKQGEKFNQLWAGDTTGYPSESEADLALASIFLFWTNGDRDWTPRLIRQSRLWDEKWEREDYQKRTFDKALEKMEELYRPENPHAGFPNRENSVMLGDISTERGYEKIEAIKGENIQIEQPIKQKVELQTTTAAALMKRELPETKWAVPNLIPEGLTILAGRPKIGKSWMALSIAAAVACGGYALRNIRVEEGEALYVGLEDNLRRLQKRVKLLFNGGNPEKLHLVNDIPRLDKGGIKVLAEWLDKHLQVRLVVIDTLARVKPHRKPVNSNEYDIDYSIIGEFQKFALDRGLALIIVHHTRKMEAENVIDEISGTTGISGAADVVIVLKRKGAETFLYVTGRDVETQELAVKFDIKDGVWTILGEAHEYMISNERRAILDVLRKANEPLTPKEIADELQKKNSTIRVLLWKLLQEGLVSKVDGKYVLSTR